MEEFKKQFIDKCDAAKKPGKYTYVKCPTGSSVEAYLLTAPVVKAARRGRNE